VGAALVGWLVYETFGYVVGQSAQHLNLALAAIPPLVALVVHELIAPRTRWRPEVLGLLLAGLAVAQFFTSSEVLATTVMMTALTLAVTAITARASRPVLRAAAERLIRAGAVTAVVAGAALAYPAWYTFAGPLHTSRLPIAAPPYRADLAGLVVPSSLQAIAPGWAVHLTRPFDVNDPVESGAYLGLPLVLMCAFGAVWLWRRPLVRVAAVMILISLVLSLGTSLTITGSPLQPGYGRGLWLPERVLYSLPLGSDVLAIRLTLYTALFAAILFALVLDGLRLALAPRLGIPAARDAALVAAAAVGLVPLIPAWPYGTQPVPVSAFFTSGAVRSIPSGSAVLLRTCTAFAYPIWFTVAGSQSTKGLPGGARDFGADLAAVVVPSRMQAFAPAWAVHVASHFVGGGLGENGAYLGVPLVLTCAAGAIWLWHRPTVKVAAVMMLASLILSLGPSLSVDGPTDLPGVGRGPWLPERLLYHLPLGSEVKTVRISLFTALFAAVILAAVLDELWTRLADRRSPDGTDRARRRFPVVALAFACLVPLIPAWPYGTQALPVPSFFSTAAVRRIPPGSTVLLYPFPAFADDHAAGMVWQSEAFMRFRIVGGNFIVNDGRGAVFFNRISATYLSLESAYQGRPRPLSPVLRAAMDSELAAWNVSVVVADPDGATGARGVAFLTEFFGRPPDPVDGVDIWTGVTPG
jgi:hypothetical protein